MRIVIDTNIWVSGLLWRGPAWRLLRLAEAGKVELCMTESMLDELAEVLCYPHLQPRLQTLKLSVADLLAYVLHQVSFFEVTDGPIIVKADPDDDVFVRCAQISGAAYLVSGDHHLLDLGAYAGIQILAVQDFLTQIFPNTTL
jgi:putative PIN family toxin of toxin-antitoxin system